MSTETDEYQELLEFFYLCPVALMEIDEAGDVQMMNSAGTQLFMQVVRHPNLSNVFEFLGTYLPGLRDLVVESAGSKGVICQNLRIDAGRPSKRATQDLVLLLSLVRISAGRIVATAQDISWSAAKEKEARESEANLRLVMDGARDVSIVSVNARGMVQFWNESAERLFGFCSAETVGRPLDETIALAGVPDDSADIAGVIAKALAGEASETEGWVRRQKTTQMWVEVSANPTTDRHGVVGGATVVVHDATRRHREQLALREQAQTDSLTGLPNRKHFGALAGAEHSRYSRSGALYCVGMLDADHFKSVNDTYGHAAGDHVLRTIAKICRASLREVDFVGRYGGEEFALVFCGTDIHGANTSAERIRRAIAAHPFDCDGESFQVTVSIGIAQVGDTVPNVDLLLERADLALYEAKELGRDRVEVFVGAELSNGESETHLSA